MHKILFIFLCLSSFSILGQTSSKDAFSSTHLEKLSGELDYDKTKRALVPRKQRKEPEKKLKKRKEKKAIEEPGIPGSIFGYVLGGILLTTILYYLIVALVARKNKPSNLSEDDLDAIEQIEDQDLDSLLEQKLAEKNYRISFRIQFLKLLQTLAQQKMINWQPNKTNGTYVRECKKGPIKEKFRKITQVFDHTWYGNSEITEEDYYLIKDYVSDLQNEIETIHE